MGSAGQDGDGWGIYAQAYNADGSTTDGSFIASGTLGEQQLYNGSGIVTQSGTVASTDGVAIGGIGYADIAVLGAVVATNGAAIAVSNGALAVTIGSTGNILSTSDAGIDARASDSTYISNAGTISGNTQAIIGAQGIDVIYNTGTLLGDVNLRSGNDLFDGRGGTMTGSVFGGSGNDKIHGSDTDDMLFGGADHDILMGRKGEDTLEGGSGTDEIRGGADDDTIDGGNHNDLIWGQSGNDTILGGNGNDVVHGGSDDDTINMGAGNDTGNGGSGDDFIFGETGKDTINGGNGADHIDGGVAADVLSGGKGDDTIIGGNGGDTFVFTILNGFDVVTDFQDGKDDLDFSAYGVTNGGTVKDNAIDTSAGWLVDLGALGGEGYVLVEGITESQITGADMVLA